MLVFDTEEHNNKCIGTVFTHLNCVANMLKYWDILIMQLKTESLFK